MGSAAVCAVRAGGRLRGLVGRVLVCGRRRGGGLEGGRLSTAGRVTLLLRALGILLLRRLLL